MAQCYAEIGLSHFRFRDYREAIRCFRIAVALPITPYNTTYVIHARNNLGLSYQKLHIPDSSRFSRPFALGNNSCERRHPYHYPTRQPYAIGGQVFRHLARQASSSHVFSIKSLVIMVHH